MRVVFLRFVFVRLCLFRRSLLAFVQSFLGRSQSGLAKWALQELRRSHCRLVLLCALPHRLLVSFRVFCRQRSRWQGTQHQHDQCHAYDIEFHTFLLSADYDLGWRRDAIKFQTPKNASQHHRTERSSGAEKRTQICRQIDQEMIAVDLDECINPLKRALEKARLWDIWQRVLLPCLRLSDA